MRSSHRYKFVPATQLDSLIAGWLIGSRGDKMRTACGNFLAVKAFIEGE